MICILGFKFLFFYVFFFTMWTFFSHLNFFMSKKYFRVLKLQKGKNVLHVLKCDSVRLKYVCIWNLSFTYFNFGDFFFQSVFGERFGLQFVFCFFWFSFCFIQMINTNCVKGNFHKVENQAMSSNWFVCAHLHSNLLQFHPLNAHLIWTFR